MKTAIVGYGYWGPNLVRNFNSTEHSEVVMVFDLSEKQLERVRKAYPKIHTTTRYEDIIDNPEIDAVAIATPVFTHFGLAHQALLAGKHVLIEKPMTSSVAEARELMEIAGQNYKVLMVDHTYLYTDAVQKIKQLVQAGEIGKVQYIDSTRINLGLFQRDVNVLWDLAPHDISICNYLMDDFPVAVQAVGAAHTANNLANIAYLTLFYQDNKIAHFNCSWVSPVKIRQMLIGGDKKMILFNDLETTEKLRIYDKGYSIMPESDRDRLLIDYRIGDITIPKIPQTEALTSMAKDFIRSIQTGNAPLSSSTSGLQVVKILEAAEKSIQNKGKYIEFE